MSEDKGLQTAVRLSSETVKRLDAVARDIEAKTPGLKVTRSDALRMAIENGLKVMGGKPSGKKVSK